MEILEIAFWILVGYLALDLGYCCYLDWQIRRRHEREDLDVFLTRRQTDLRRFGNDHVERYR